MNIFVVIWIVSLLFLLVSFKSELVANLFSYPLAFCAFILAGIRSDMYPDYQEYQNIFYDIQKNEILSIEFLTIHGEIGFKLILKLIGLIFGGDIFLFVSMASFSFYLLHRICVNNKLHFPVVWLVYYSSSFLLKDMVQMRNAIASLLIVYSALEFSAGRNKKAYLTIVVSALCFQYLAVINIISRINLKLKFTMFLLFVAIISYFVVNFDLLIRYFGFYGYVFQYYDTDYVNPEQFSALPALIRLIFLLAFFGYFIRLGAVGIQGKLMNMLVYSFIFYLAFANIPILSQRLGGYFLSADAFIFSALVMTNKSKAVLSVIILYSFVVFFFNLTSRAHLQYEYQWIF